MVVVFNSHEEWEPSTQDIGSSVEALGISGFSLIFGLEEATHALVCANLL